MSRLRTGWEALQDKLQQSAETVTRNARIDISGGDVDEIDPPEYIDEYAEQAKETAIVRANLRQYVQDVTKPGYRLEGPDKTVAFFLGEDAEEVDTNPPEGTPDGGFLENCFIIGGEKRKGFYFGLQQAIWERWVRGTVLIEYIKDDKDDPESEINGFKFIRPETVYPQVYRNTNTLIDPDDTDTEGIETTRRDEAAAYIQFDDRSILGLRRQGFNNDSINLSQNDVMKQTLEPDIGGDDRLEDGIFGRSVMDAISIDVEEYNEIKRDRARAIKTKAYGIWNAQFTPETIDLGNGSVEILEWDDKSIDETEGELKDLGPGSVVTSDAPIDLEKFDGDVPDLDPTLKHYVNDIMSALPAPKYTTGFGEEITQFVSERQENAYEDTKQEERQYQERSWTQAFKTVARRKGLDTDGLKLKIEPEENDSPVMSLSVDDLEKIQMLGQALNEMAGNAGVASLVDREAIVTEIAQLPEDAIADVDIEEVIGTGGSGSSPIEENMDPGPDGVDQPGENEGDHVDPTEDDVDELDPDAMYQDWADMVDVEALADFSEGDAVDTPDGFGVVSEIRDSEFEGPDGETWDPDEDNPVYVVALEDGAAVFEEDDLEDGELPEVDVENPESDLEALFDLADAVEGDAEALQDGHFSWPESWQESDTPARVIALRAWAAMGGRHTGCVREMRGNISRPNAFCADFKDRILGWEGWRQGG